MFTRMILLSLCFRLPFFFGWLGRTVFDIGTESLGRSKDRYVDERDTGGRDDEQGTKEHAKYKGGREKNKTATTT